MLDYILLCKIIIKKKKCINAHSKLKGKVMKSLFKQKYHMKNDHQLIGGNCKLYKKKKKYNFLSIN